MPTCGLLTPLQQCVIDAVKAHPGLSQAKIAAIAGVALSHVCVTLQKINNAPKEQSKFLFLSPRPSHGNEHTAPQVFDKNCLRPLGYITGIAHGFRKSFRNWAGAQKVTLRNGKRVDRWSRTAIEYCLSHYGEVGKTEGSYWTDDLRDDRKEIGQCWADYCLSVWQEGAIAPTADSAVVVPLRRGPGRPRRS